MWGERERQRGRDTQRGETETGGEEREKGRRERKQADKGRGAAHVHSWPGYCLPTGFAHALRSRSAALCQVFEGQARCA